MHVGSLLDPAGGALEEAMRFRVARAAVLAGNIANADTPGYRRLDLRFDEALGRAEARLARTHPEHLPAGGAAAGAPWRLEQGPRGTRPDRNGVDFEQELIAMQRNAGAFTDLAAALARLQALVRTAIGTGG